MKFSVDDRVYIREDSDYKDEIEKTNGNIGVITKITDDSHPYMVDFHNGFSNTYREKDLKYVSWRAVLQ